LSGHTPGPWRVESFETELGPIHQILATVKKYPSTVCTVEEYEEVPDFDADRLADAHLLAAAPDLLEALKLADCLLSGANMNRAVVERKVRAAIAKATGSTP
jgi:hypothetical protein